MRASTKRIDKAIQSDLFARMRFGNGKVEFEQRTTSFPTDEEFHYFTIVALAAEALFICRETSRRASFARISSEEISDSLDRSWIDGERREKRAAEERARGNGTARHCEISPAGGRQAGRHGRWMRC